MLSISESFHLDERFSVSQALAFETNSPVVIYMTYTSDLANEIYASLGVDGDIFHVEKLFLLGWSIEKLSRISVNWHVAVSVRDENDESFHVTFLFSEWKNHSSAICDAPEFPRIDLYWLQGKFHLISQFTGNNHF